MMFDLRCLIADFRLLSWLLKVAALVVWAQSCASTPCPAAITAEPLESSVRITVSGGNGQTVGSGTIVDSNRRKSLILTCAHIFRDHTDRSRITVETFDTGKPVEHVGHRIYHNSSLDLDIGFAMIEAGEFPYSRVIDESQPIMKGMPVVGSGCRHGAIPTLWHPKIIAVDKWLGPSTVDVTPAAAQGRSGSGLFLSDGTLIGVCSAASPMQQDTLFMGHKPVYQVFRLCQSKQLIGGNISIGPTGLSTGANVGPVGAQFGIGASSASHPQAAAEVSTRRTLYRFSTSNCAPCVRWEKDYAANAAGMRERIDREFSISRKDLTKDAALARKYQVSRAPTFVADDGSIRIVGYESPERFLAELPSKKFERSSVAGPAIEPYTGNPPRLFDDPPAPLQVASAGATFGLGAAAGASAGIFDPNWLNVDIVLCIPEGSLGEHVARAAELAKKYGASRNTVPIGELESMVAELTQGKARIHVVTERFSPHRFASYGAALSIGSEPISLTAFVKQEATGIKGAVMGVLEKLARSKVGDISLSSARLLTVFERVEPVKYADALAAVNSAEPVHEKAPVPSAHGSDQSSGLATGSEAVGAGAADSAKEEDGGIIKWLLGLLFGGAGATELVRRRLDSRIAQLKELIGIHNASKGGPSA